MTENRFLLGTQSINEAGHLTIGGCDVHDLAAKYGTPLYVMDEATLREKMRALRNAFDSRRPGTEIIYASKAFPSMAMSRIVAQEGLWIDVASAGELYTALRADFPRERIVFHGNNKSHDELEMAVRAQIGRIVVDNETEMEVLDEIAAAASTRQAILLRLTPAVDPHTHHLIQTGRVDTKFGMNIEGGGARRGLEKALSLENLEVKGIGSHIGSQILDADFFRLGARLMCEFLAEAKAELNFVAEELDLGGGLGIRYLPGDNPPTMDEYAAEVVGTVEQECARLGLEVPRLAIEPGRSIAGEAGITIYSVGHVKRIPNVRNYVAVDGGISDNPRPALYEAKYHAVNASRMNDTQSETVTISGKHCETDTLITDIEIATPQKGDLIAVLSTGAYNHAMASNYNRFRRPAVVLVNEGQSDVIVERETLQDLLLHDIVPERLLISENGRSLSTPDDLSTPEALSTPAAQSTSETLSAAGVQA